MTTAAARQLHGTPFAEWIDLACLANHRPGTFQLTPARPVAIHARLHVTVQRLADAGRPGHPHLPGSGPERCPTRMAYRHPHSFRRRVAAALWHLGGGVWRAPGDGCLAAGSGLPAYLFSQATTYGQLLVCALLFGLAGNSFSAGIAWNSAWFPQREVK